jgi:hypothetical protein
MPSAHDFFILGPHDAGRHLVALGAAKTDTAFQETANAIAAVLHPAGVLAGSVPQN